ncbi:DUF1330 domain-containing protein [Polynucleobacter necessarius]|uniref:DUF1330 domain-containing protein n=1 Tax=Polynucleobacter necessarius TaxID=576610 RepID=UPI000E08FF69|nr:DUF1330 domain-containing protein [Polynucleobacter necessarius]HAT39310.1 hypothetical protein [Polynucleobacter sp.]
MVKAIDLIELIDQRALEEYRSQVSETVESYKGSIKSRGSIRELFWNELGCAPFSTIVELEFSHLENAHSWVVSREYQALVPIRNKAMKLTLFSIAT